MADSFRLPDVDSIAPGCEYGKVFLCLFTQKLATTASLATDIIYDGLPVTKLTGIRKRANLATMIEMKAIGDALKQRRKKLGLSLDDAEAASGVHASNLSRYESGSRWISVANLQKLADAYGVGVIRILRDAGFK